MYLLWPRFLYFLGLIPLLGAFYFWMLRRKRRYAVRYASLALVRPAVSGRGGWMRHLPFVLFLLALGSLGFACGRPYFVGSFPSDQTVIILALDVSRSMCNTDIAPNRLLAAEQAALGFIQRQKPTTQIGLIAFSGFAELIQPPTADPQQLQSALHSLMLGSTTAIGSGILRSLDAIAEVDPNISPSQPAQAGDPAGDAVGELSGRVGDPPLPTPLSTSMLLQPDIIILLTDGVSNTGPEPLNAAQQAAERGVRVYTIGYGTADGDLYPACPPDFVGGEPNGGFMRTQVDNDQPHGLGGQFRDQEQGYLPYVEGAGGSAASRGYPRGIDEKTLQQVSALTGGAYYPADSAGELHQVFQELSTLRITRRAAHEVSVAFAALGALLAVSAMALSHLWRPV
jgi:Ca-activated chloride channel family protein